MRESRDKPRTTGICECGCGESLTVQDATYCWKCIRNLAKYVIIKIYAAIIIIIITPYY